MHLDFSIVAMVFLSISMMTCGKETCDIAPNINACFASVVESAQKIEESSAISGTVEEMQVITDVCRKYNAGVQCTENFLNSCPVVSEGTRLKVYMYINSVIKQGIVRFCEDHEMLRGYMVHASCLHKHQNETRTCILDNKKKFAEAMVNFDTMDNPGASEVYCKLITELFLCGRKVLDEDCSQEAGNLFVEVASDFLPSEMIDFCKDKYGRKTLGMTVSTVSAAENTLSYSYPYFGMFMLVLLIFP